MKRKQKSLGVLAAVILGWAAPAMGHDECDDEPLKPAAVAEGAKPQPLGNAVIKLFQFQPGRIEVKTGTLVSWVNEDEILHSVTAEKKEKVLRRPGRQRRELQLHFRSAGNCTATSAIATNICAARSGQ